MSSRSDLRAANDDSNEEGVLTFDHILAKSCLEGERPAITALKASEPVRDVRLKWDHATGDYRTLNVERRANYEALLIQATGELPEQECERCVSGWGPFTECVTSPIAGNGACGNCHYNSQGTKCGYHRRNTDTAKKDGTLPEDQPTGPATNKRTRTGNETILVAQAQINSAGGPGPATLAYRTANAFRPPSLTASGSSNNMNPTVSHGGLRDLEAPDSNHANDVIHVADQGSRPGPPPALRVQDDQSQARKDTIKIEDSDDDMEVAGPRLGRQMLNAQPPISNLHMPQAGILAPLANMNLAAVAGFPALGSAPAVARPAPANLAGPAAAYHAFPFARNTPLSYDETRRFARELRSLGDDYDDHAERMLSRELTNGAGAPAAAAAEFPSVRGTISSLSYSENRLMARQFRALAEDYDARAEGMLARQV